jgi:aminoglycoside phosphotransferase (APT) family kinase protein
MMNIGNQFVAWLKTKLDTATDVKLLEMDLPATGLSAETAMVTISYQNPEPVTEKLVVRGGPRTRGIFPDYSLQIQAGIMKALANTVVPVPNVRWYEPDSAIIGCAFLVMDFIDGEVPSDTPPGFHGHGLYHNASIARRSAMWQAGLEKMALLHSLNWRSLNLPELPGMADDAHGCIQGHVALFEKWMDWGDAHNLEPIEAGMEWLKTTPVPASNLALLWCDGRPGNILHRKGEPIALLDWELACIGLPEFDLMYWWWSAEFLADVNKLPMLEGINNKARTIERYESFVGRSVTDAIDYAETYVLLRMALMNILGIRAAVSEIYTDDFLLENRVVHRLTEKLKL